MQNENLTLAIYITILYKLANSLTGQGISEPGSPLDTHSPGHLIADVIGSSLGPRNPRPAFKKKEKKKKKRRG